MRPVNLSTNFGYGSNVPGTDWRAGLLTAERRANEFHEAAIGVPQVSRPFVDPSPDGSLRKVRREHGELMLAGDTSPAWRDG